MFNQYLQNLSNINRYLTDTDNRYKVSVILVKYRLSISVTAVGLFQKILLNTIAYMY